MLKRTVVLSERGQAEYNRHRTLQYLLIPFALWSAISLVSRLAGGSSASFGDWLSKNGSPLSVGLLLAVAVVILMMYVLAYSPRKKLRMIQRSGFSGDLFLLRRSFGLFPDLEAKGGQKLFSIFEDEIMVVGFSVEEVLIWGNRQGALPYVALKLSEIRDARLGYGRSISGKSLGLELRINTVPETRVVLLLQSNETLGFFRIGYERLTAVVDRVAASLP
ncbi:hypothetical protein [Lysinibacter sp. HNR]|uniref:hypothetical protein n=1 Tax=Lysinibacter sp. HNR TaxID=3031408 RepID=UPI002434BE39|nr:hypothetical protein [Lysinibacter sp. HNR]WGD37433.1 hypothetical protein FrondiHNR_00485 [Lysinibacter sp. HNR]